MAAGAFLLDGATALARQGRELGRVELEGLRCVLLSVGAGLCRPGPLVLLGLSLPPGLCPS
eukprot:6605202-Pyramimonas_sp.AAC.1